MTNFKNGTLTINNRDFTYQVKRLSEGSDYGIDYGRISKLTLWSNGTIIARYDRGWDLETTETAAQTALATILELHN